MDTLPVYSASAEMGTTVLDAGPPPPLGPGEMERQQHRPLAQQVVFSAEPWVDAERGSGSSSRREFLVGRSEPEGALGVRRGDEGHDVYDPRHDEQDSAGMYKFIQEGYPPPPPPPGG